MESNVKNNPALMRDFCCHEAEMTFKPFRLCACGRPYLIDGDRSCCDVCAALAEDWRYARRYDQLRERAMSQRRDQSARQATVDAAYTERAEAVVEADVARMLASAEDEADHGETATVRR